MIRQRSHQEDTKPAGNLSRSVLAIVALLAFLVPTSVPHSHGASDHEAEICAGHLSHDGAEDALHAGSCSACETTRRSELDAAPAISAPVLPPAIPAIAHHGEPCHNPIRPSGDCDKTRAPPATSLNS